MDGNSPHWRKWRQEPHGILGWEPKDILSFADDDKGLKEFWNDKMDEVNLFKNLFILVVGVDVLKRDGGEVWRELCSQSDGQWHSTLQLGICAGTILLLVIIIPSLNIENILVSHNYTLIYRDGVNYKEKHFPSQYSRFILCICSKYSAGSKVTMQCWYIQIYLYIYKPV